MERIAVRVAQLVAPNLPRASKSRPDTNRLTVKEAAEEIGCSTRQVRRLVATGRLRSSKLTHGGSSRLFLLREDVARVLAEAEGRP